MKNRSIRKWLSMGALALSATIVQASFINAARAAEEPGTAAVRIGDLNLASSVDVATLYGRINSAATRVCTTDAQTGEKLFGNDKTRCVAASVSRAVAEVQNAGLTAFHQQEVAAR
ncbi:MAG: UrcA family protein [Rhodanobacteraceae bacterium]